jgi:hypothetical protein
MAERAQATAERASTAANASEACLVMAERRTAAPNVVQAVESRGCGLALDGGRCACCPWAARRPSATPLTPGRFDSSANAINFFGTADLWGD